MKRSLAFPALVFVAFSSTIAQDTTAPGTGTVPGTGLRQNPESSSPIILSGKVAMADGSPVPDSVAIQRVCGETRRTVAYTDRKGQFSFQGGQARELLPDASEPVSGAGRLADGVAMSGCELRVEVPGYRSDSISLGTIHSTDVGTIVLHRLANVEGLSVSATSFKAPPEARKAYDKGLESLHKGKAADAEKDFENAVAIYPQYANAWLDLGKARMQTKSVEPARQAFEKALEADDKLVEAHVELGMLAAQQSRWPDAAKHLDTAIQLDPVDFPHIWFVDAAANYNVKNFDGAEKSAREALKLDPRHNNPQADRLLGMILAAKRDYSGAVAELRTYLRLAPDAADVAQVKTQLSEIEKLQTPKQP